MHINIFHNLILYLDCEPGYEDIKSNNFPLSNSGSKYCYKIVDDDDDEKTYESARNVCKSDGGELACFEDVEMRNLLSDKCDDCWVGYKWKGDSIKGSWKSESSDCPEKVVAGQDWGFDVIGSCARTTESKLSKNKLTRKPCKSKLGQLFKFGYICQTRKKGKH